MAESVRICFIANSASGGAAAIRAQEFAARLPVTCSVICREGGRVRSLYAFLRTLWNQRPDIVYVVDNAVSGVLAGAIYKLVFRKSLVLDTGDAIYELAKSVGGRGWLGLAATWALEQFSYRVADRVIVRGTYHQELLSTQGVSAAVIQDGVDIEQFKPLDVSIRRRELGLEGVTTVGLVGSSVWSSKLQMCYGWELVRLVRLLKEEPIKGVMIGDGTGISYLKKYCVEHEIEHRVLFLGRVPYHQLPEALNLIDVCLSTQTNDVVGQVRTTGKLPLYLATGRYVLASDVGEASRVLPAAMRVPYSGTRDDGYPARVAGKLRDLLQAHRLPLSGRSEAVSIAAQTFSYEILSRRLQSILNTL